MIRLDCSSTDARFSRSFVTRTAALSAAVSAVLLAAGLSRAADFVVTKSADSVIDTRGLTLDSSVAQYGIGINGNSFENSAIQTVNGWQYTAYWVRTGSSSTSNYVAVARRQIGTTAWQVANLTNSVFSNGLNGTRPSDAHNVVSLGIDQTDGTIHLAYDLHGHTLKYRVSTAGVTTNPGSYTAAQWSQTLFGAQTGQLVSGTTVTGATYPHFFNTPAGGLQFTYRTGASGNGSNWIGTYNGAAHTWGNVHQYDDGAVGTYVGTVTNGDTNRNSYINGATYGPTGRLYQSFTWREGASGAANHDIAFVYSDDGGNIWKNNAGTVVGNAGTGQKWNLTTPGLTVVPLDESQSLMNQQTQAVTSDDKFHTVMWHRDTAKANTGGVYTPTESSYFDYWRDGTGNWHRSKLPGSVGSRPKLFFDANDNAFAIYQTGTFSSAGIYINNGNLVIAAATKGSNWNDWKVIKTETGPFVSEAAADAALFKLNGTLSVTMQNSPGVTNPAQATNMRALDYTFNITPAVDRTTTASGDWLTPATWGGTVPTGNANAIVNGNRGVTLASGTTANVDAVTVGSGGTVGELIVVGGSTLNVAGSLSIGRGAGTGAGTSGPNYAQSGGTVTAWRMAVGDYNTTANDGGFASASIFSGSLTLGELQIAMGRGTSNSSFGTGYVSGTAPVVTVNGEVIVGDLGNNARLSLKGGTMTVAGDIREGLSGSISSVDIAGGTLDMTGNSILTDTVLLNTGRLQNVKAIRTGTITKDVAGTIAFAGNNTFSQPLVITTGVIRAESNAALGTTAGNTTISDGPGVGLLQLVNGITLAEPIVLAGRQPFTSGDTAHITNVAGTNTLTGPISTAMGGNQYNVSSDAGKLIVTGSFTNTATGGAADVRTLKLMGDADGDWRSAIGNAAGNAATTAITKMGAGTWLLSGANTYTGVTAIKGGTLSVSAATNTLTNAGGVDLADAGGTLAVTYTAASPAAMIDGLLTTANAGNFAAGQIRSTDLAVGHIIGLNDDAAGTVRVRVTLAGDADLNGQVDFNDFLKLQNNFGAAGTRFDQGDFNYDGTTDFNDFLALQNNFGQSISGRPAPVSRSEVAAMTAFAAAVPEPASLSIVGLAAVALIRRRRSA